MTNSQIVVSPAIAPENIEPLEFLSELISDSLGRLDTLKRSASTAVLDLLEANVRLGWYLEDSRHFLQKEGTYIAWVEKTFPISYVHTTRLRALAKRFCRDAIDADSRRKLAINIPGLTEIGEHVRRQIVATQAGCMADLFRYAGLLNSPDRSNSEGTNGNTKPAQKISNAKVVKVVVEAVTKLSNFTTGTKPDRLSPSERARLIVELKEIIRRFMAADERIEIARAAEERCNGERAGRKDSGLRKPLPWH